jgi:hypothetical protein
LAKLQKSIFFVFDITKLLKPGIIYQLKWKIREMWAVSKNTELNCWPVDLGEKIAAKMEV